MRSALAGSRFALFFMWCVLAVPLQIAVLALHKGRFSYVIPYFWHKGVCLIFGLRVRIEGEPCKKRQTLFVSNHLSYLDIPVIGGVLMASFVAKNDVARWPVFGFLSRLQQTAFIERSRSAAAREKSALDSMLAEGRSLIIFPEGTSTDGRNVLPFKSSVFALALGGSRPDLMVQPFTIRLDRAGGRTPDTQEIRDLYAWHRDMTTELPVHLWRFAGSPGATITLRFHPAFRASEHTDRKEMAKLCHEDVAKGLEKIGVAA